MEHHSVKKLLLATPRGFCAGVARAVKAVEDTLLLFGAPVYVKHEIVHNRHVVAALEAQGAITIETIEEAPEGAVVVFSAHGSPPAHYALARRHNMRLIDATCPLVTKVHLEVLRYLKEGYQIIYIGHRGHIEGIGVLAEAESRQIPLVETVADVEALDLDNPAKIVYLTQTTLSIDETAAVIEALRKKYPQIAAPPLSDICYATTNRQRAVKALAAVAELILILGSKNSSNSTRLMETARAQGKQAYLIDDVSELDASWLKDVKTVGVSAGASAPETLVQGIVAYFARLGIKAEDFAAVPETMHFVEPLELGRLKREGFSSVR